MTKKLTKVAMTTALAAAAIVPAVVATPAQAAEAEVTFAKAYYSTANGTAAFEAGKLAGVISATTDTGITHLEASNGEVFTMQAFSAYLAVNPTATTDQVLTALSKAGKALSADQVKALNVKEGKVVNGKVTVDADAPVGDVKVESVKAINASEVTVTFSSDVDAVTAKQKNNYQLKINNVDVTPAQILDIAVTGNKATLLLDSSAVAFQSGDKYVIQTNDAIKSKAGKEFPKYVSAETTFTESAAPVLKDVKPSVAGLVLTFDRPVKSSTGSDVTLIKVDGVAITSKDLKPVTAKTGDADILGGAGKYVYNVALTPTELAPSITVGDHEVVIYDVADTAVAYAKVASVVTGTYKITDQVVAPEVTSVEAINANKFFLYTNVGVTLSADTKLIVEKGNHEFSLIGSPNPTFDDALASSTTEVDAVAGVHPVNGKPGIFVVVTDAAATDENPLYKSGETTATLKVTIENYTASGIVGKKSVETVTLNKNNSKPAIAESKVVGNNLEITFNDALATLASSPTALTSIAAADLVVRDKDGIVIAPTGPASVSGKVVTVPLTKADAGPYTVEFKADKFKNLENASSVKGYLVNTMKNEKLTATVAAKETNFQYSQFAFASGEPTVSNNEITFTYDVEMSDTARNAANYTLDGKVLPTGSTVDFVGDKKTVRVTLPEGSLKSSTSYKFGISTDVTTKAGSHIVGSLQTKAPVEAVITLADNIKPELKSATYLIADENVKPSTTTDQIEITFNEKLANITDNAASQNDFKVVVNGSTIAVTAVTDGTNGDEKLVLTLGQKINVNQATTISIIPEDLQNGDKEIVIKDIAGNKANTDVSVTATNSKYSSALAAAAEAAAVAADKAAITASATITVDGAVTLPTTGTNGSTITWAETTDASNVASLSGNTVTFTRSAADNNDDTVVLTATIKKGTTTDTQTVTYTVKEALAPTVANKLPGATTGVATNNTALVFSEAIDETSRNAVKTIVESAYAVQGDATVAVTWNTDNKTVIVTVTNNTGSVNIVAATVPANFKVKDLAGNESAVLALTDLQTP